MAHPIHGKGAVIFIATSAAGVANPLGNQISWSLDFDMSTVDVTPLNTANFWKNFVKGMKGWTGTFAGNFDTGNQDLWTASLADDPVNFYLYPNYARDAGATYYYGTAWIQLAKIAEGSTTTKASSGFKATGDGPLSVH